MKICTKCKRSQPLGNFNKTKAAKDGYKYWCKDCMSKSRKKWSDSERGQAIKKAYYRKNKHILNKWYNTLEGRYKEYIRSAIKRGLLFSLTLEECRQFQQTICSYCGEKYTFLGIDRIDNTKGYTLDNCTPCCSMCNRMKAGYKKEDFINKVRQISLNNKE